MDTISALNPTNKPINISSTNLLEKYKYPTVPTNESKDTIVLNRDFIADLRLNKEKAAIGTIVEGSINNKPATFKVVSNNNKELWYEGALDKKYFILHCKDKTYDGKYGNTEFSLTTDYNKPSKFSEFFNQKLLGKVFMPNYFRVKGTIGDKNIDITIPGIKIPEDKETCDLLTILLEENGLKAQTINGEIKSIKFAQSAIKDIKKRIEKRKKRLDNDIKPIFMQGISTATGLIIGSVVSALLFKFGLKR